MSEQKPMVTVDRTPQMRAYMRALSKLGVQGGEHPADWLLEQDLHDLVIDLVWETDGSVGIIFNPYRPSSEYEAALRHALLAVSGDQGYLRYVMHMIDETGYFQLIRMFSNNGTITMGRPCLYEERSLDGPDRSA